MQFKGRVIGKDVSRISQNICTQVSFLEVNYLNPVKPAVAVTTLVSFFTPRVISRNKVSV